MVRLVLGDHHKNKVEDEDLLQPVARIIDHPDYDRFQLTGDISLLQLAAPVQLTDYIRPICLPSVEDEVLVGTQCTISGWGATQNSGENNDVLRDAEVPILSNNQCNNWLQQSQREFDTNFITKENICAGLREGGKDSCQGDSGGPLACPNTQGRYSLEGVVSWGFGCADRKSPGVYTRVSEFLPWITEMMEQYKDAPEFFRLETTPCGSVVTTEQTIRLPVDEKTHLYNDGMDCKFTIRPPANHKTEITFVGRYAIEPGCSEDSLVIYKESGARVKKMPCKFGGLDELSTIVEEGNLEIRFKSDKRSAEKRYSGYEGFAAKIEFAAVTSTSPSTTTTTEPTTPTQDCKDKKPLKKCKKALRKNKCGTKGNRKKCRLTCGHCQVE